MNVPSFGNNGVMQDTIRCEGYFCDPVQVAITAAAAVKKNIKLFWRHLRMTPLISKVMYWLKNILLPSMSEPGKIVHIHSNTNNYFKNICHGKVPKRMLDFLEDLRYVVSLALSYFSLRFPIEEWNRNFRCLFSKTSDVLFNDNFDVRYYII